MEPGLGAVVQHMGGASSRCTTATIAIYLQEADVWPLSSRFTESFFALAYSVSVALFIQAATMMRHQPPRQAIAYF
jgi:hypothetical protein